MALILIVDDSPTEVFVMQKALEKHGFKTAAAENGAEGIRKAKEMKPDLIFMDIVMPGVNGYQATRALINDPETSLIPIIMVTTKGQETDRVWGLRQGAVDYLVKPVSAQALVEKAQAALAVRRVPIAAPSTICGASATGRSNCSRSWRDAVVPSRPAKRRTRTPVRNGSVWRFAWAERPFSWRARKLVRSSGIRPS